MDGLAKGMVEGSSEEASAENFYTGPEGGAAYSPDDGTLAVALNLTPGQLGDAINGAFDRNGVLWYTEVASYKNGSLALHGHSYVEAPPEDVRAVKAFLRSKGFTVPYIIRD